MDVILTERIAKLGQIGEVVKVRDGFARNFLLPRGKAMRATKANREKFESLKAQYEARNLELKREAETVAEALDGQSFAIIRNAAESGQLYGSVSARDIALVLEAGGFTVDKGQVDLNVPIKTVGVHNVPVQLHAEVEVTVKVAVARNADDAERLLRGESIASDRDDGIGEDLDVADFFQMPSEREIPGVPGTGPQPDIE